MSPLREFVALPVWDDDELEARRREAIADFITARNAEGSVRYRAAFSTALSLVDRLFEATSELVDFRSGAGLAEDPRLVRVARYLGAPPISGDDLDTLAEARIAQRKRLDADLSARAAGVIFSAIDPERFPWLFADPPGVPTSQERDKAVSWTAGLIAASETQLGRRSEASGRQEQAVRDLLLELGLREVPPRSIDITGGLTAGEFSQECLVVGTKCDVPVGLWDGRLLLIECKVSNSAVNSVKRLNREVGGKTQYWRGRLGDRAIPAAVLAGVFKLGNLKAAQGTGTTLFWERDLRSLSAFIHAAR